MKLHNVARSLNKWNCKTKLNLDGTMMPASLLPLVAHVLLPVSTELKISVNYINTPQQESLFLPYKWAKLSFRDQNWEKNRNRNFCLLCSTKTLFSVVTFTKHKEIQVKLTKKRKYSIGTDGALRCKGVTSISLLMTNSLTLST